MASWSAATPPSGNSSGWSSAYDIRELSLGPYTSPSPSGTLTRSRGTDTSETVLPTGSSDTTIIVSVRVARPPRQRVDAEEQDVDPLVERRLGRGPARRLPGDAARSEDPCEGVAEGRPVAVDDDVGQDDGHDDDEQAR